ncbi:YeiH family protein [Robinsoniella sp. KNHs210]|uniref:YeiH family protein n=1 Tax=Robinsoniella sp. KNHs210 TaxID=1469950 RepID=UPI000484FC05|nr:putative sulfate exporter family transporter [Robinsoniella sp. KNHs210]
MKKFTEPLKNLIPGFIVCLIISCIAQIISSFVPAVGSALFAIGIGILCGNTFLNRESLNKGCKFSESMLLEYSIVLTGLTLHLSDILGVGISGIIFIALQMSLTITGTYLIGKRLGFRKKFCLLMCAGNAVCGSSAIGTISPVIDADAKDKGISITIVNITGTFLMVILPVITGILYHNETIHASGMIGGVLQSIGQVIASAKFINDDVVQMATIFKIIRIVFLVVVALVFSKMNTADGEKLFIKKPWKSTQSTRISCGIPWFIIGFFIFSIISSIGIVPLPMIKAAKLISGQFEIIALAAIGMRVKFQDLLDEGPKSMLYGGLVGTMQTVLAIVLLFLV